MNNKFLSFSIILLLLFTSNNSQVQGQSNFPSYEIQPGDSLGYVADLFGTNIEDISRVNNISNPDLISPGQVILIPSYPGLQGKLTLTTTDLGETYTNLSVKYQVDSELIQQINFLLSPTTIYAGSELILLIPDESEPLIPVTIASQSQTSLELAAMLQSNPHMLLLRNHLEGVSDYLPGTVLFLDSDTNHAPLDLFSPQLGDVNLSPLPLVQGATEVISVTTDQAVTLSGNIGERSLQFFSTTPGQFYALQGVHALQKPGLVTFSLSATLGDGNSHTFTQSVLVKPGLFDEDPPLKVDPSTIDPSVTTPENDLILSMISTITPTRYWEGIFTSPAYYQEYNSLFGTRRKYNDDPTIYFHTGVDFAGGMTLPVTAPAAGQVVFSGPLSVRGNAVFIDHGWGVFSGFFHQDSLLISQGDFVEAGQQIGTVGNTGRVNGAGDYLGAGAHLHWELWVNGIQVNPLDWLTYVYP